MAFSFNSQKGSDCASLGTCSDRPSRIQNSDALAQQLTPLISSITGNRAINIGVTSPTRTFLQLANGESLQPWSKLIPNGNCTTSLPSVFPIKLSYNLLISKLNDRNGSLSKRKTFECNACGYKATRGKQLDEHTKTVHGEYRCPLCYGTCKDLGGLRRHSLCHLRHKPKHCKICTKSHSRKGKLVEHIVREHKIAEKYAKKYMKCDIKPSRSLELLQQFYGENFHAYKSIQFDNNATNQSTLSTFAPSANHIRLNRNVTTSSSMVPPINKIDHNPQQPLLSNFVIKEEMDVKTTENGNQGSNT